MYCNMWENCVHSITGIYFSVIFNNVRAYNFVLSFFEKITDMSKGLVIFREIINTVPYLFSMMFTTQWLQLAFY
jgi:hypothetical protein